MGVSARPRMPRRGIPKRAAAQAVNPSRVARPCPQPSESKYLYPARFAQSAPPHGLIARLTLVHCVGGDGVGKTGQTTHTLAGQAVPWALARPQPPSPPV
jgi:hypothetical protein